MSQNKYWYLQRYCNKAVNKGLRADLTMLKPKIVK